MSPTCSALRLPRREREASALARRIRHRLRATRGICFRDARQLSDPPQADRVPGGSRGPQALGAEDPKRYAEGGSRSATEASSDRRRRRPVHAGILAAAAFAFALAGCALPAPAPTLPGRAVAPSADPESCPATSSRASSSRNRPERSRQNAPKVRSGAGRLHARASETGRSYGVGTSACTKAYTT